LLEGNFYSFLAYLILTFYQAIMKFIFPAIDGDLLKLVHLSNSFQMVEGAKPFQVGDDCCPEARIVSVTNSSEGKDVKVKGHCYRNNLPVIEVVSSFLHRGRFVD
jgi:fatty acid synthase subunit alpha